MELSQNQSNEPIDTIEDVNRNLSLLHLELTDSDQGLFSQAHPSFPRFSDLPTELRLQIWRSLFPTPRFVRTPQHNLQMRLLEDCKKNKNKRRRKHPELPVTLHINRESREETLKYYQVVMIEHSSWRRRRKVEFPVCFSGTRDFITLGNSNMIMNLDPLGPPARCIRGSHLRCIKGDTMFQNLTELVWLGICAMRESEMKALQLLLRECKSLKRLTLIQARTIYRVAQELARPRWADDSPSTLDEYLGTLDQWTVASDEKRKEAWGKGKEVWGFTVGEGVLRQGLIDHAEGPKAEYAAYRNPEIIVRDRMYIRPWLWESDGALSGRVS